MIETTAENLNTLWDQLEIQTGDIILCHSFLASLGRLKPSTEIILDTLLDRIGKKGTLIVPAFTYSYFKNEIYDVENSASTVGILGDLLRKRENAIRSLDPNFSMVALGGDSERLMKMDSQYSLGTESIYERLIRSNLKVLLLGVDFTSLPLFMHFEKVLNTPYRYDKRFKGTTRYKGAIEKTEIVHFVRDEKTNPVSDRSRVGNLIDLEPTCKKVKHGYGIHRYVPAKLVEKVVKDSYLKDPFILLEAKKETP